MTLEIGSLVNGRYRIERVLGQGGMGAVYAAIDENLGISVALKENLFTTDEYARQFRREATILATLRHPNLPRVTDHFVIPEKGQYLVMDFVDGEDLRHRLEQQGALKETEVVEWAKQICEAVNYLHSQRRPILHRDIKPSNIRITSDGRAVLVDFGLAKMAGTTTTVGPRGMTPGFAPPEQYGGGQVDARADIYALAATVYQVSTGAMPEDGLDRAMGYASLTPVRTRNPKTSEWLASAIEKGLEVRVEDRFRSASEFHNALSAGGPTGPIPPDATRVAAHPPAGATVARPLSPAAQPRGKRRSAGCTLGIIFGVLALVGVGGYFGTRGLVGLPSVTATASDAAPALDTLPFSSTRSASEPAASHTADVAATETLPTETLTPLAPTELPAASATAPVESAGSLIAFASERTGKPQVFVMRDDGSGVRQVTDLPDGACQPDWSPDGTRLAFTSPCKGNLQRYENASIYLVNLDGSGVTPISTAPGGDFDPAWSPDGKRIAFTSLQDGPAPHIFIMDVEGNNRARLSAEGGRDYQPRWSADGTRLVFVTVPSTGDSTIFEMVADGTEKQQYSRGQGANSSPDWSRDGRLVLYIKSVSNGQVVTTLYEKRGFVENPMLVGAGGSTTARFSADNQWIVADGMDSNRVRSIWKIRVVGGGMIQLTTDGSVNYDPVCQPVVP
jgi:serine/threonine protein kinase/Tol biopolymer transport system component